MRMEETVTDNSLADSEPAEKPAELPDNWMDELAKEARDGTAPVPRPTSSYRRRYWDRRARDCERAYRAAWLHKIRARYPKPATSAHVTRSRRAPGRKPIHTRRRSGSASHSARASGSSGSSSSDPDPLPPLFRLPSLSSLYCADLGASRGCSS